MKDINIFYKEAKKQYILARHLAYEWNPDDYLWILGRDVVAAFDDISVIRKGVSRTGRLFDIPFEPSTEDREKIVLYKRLLPKGEFNESGLQQCT